MTPLFGKDHEPDERPSTGEIVGAVVLAIAVAALYWAVTAVWGTP